MTLPRGKIKCAPVDFVVEEIPSYEPSGEGTHLFLRFEKRGLTTDAAVRAITKALGIEMRDVGIAGMKDKVAVTTQWVSVPVPPKDNAIEERAKGLSIDGIVVLDAKRHGNKLKTGHLRANRFDIVVRDVAADSLESVLASIERCAKDGVPNAFGVQRFGRDGDNAERARAWLTGKERAPNDPRLRRFHFSALQSALFNAVLEARVADGSWRRPMLGDVLKKEDTGGLFLCTDVEADRLRAEQGEVAPTGPILGEKMRAPEGEVKALEDRIAAPFIEGVDLHRARSLGEGTRRALRLRVTACTVAEVLNNKGVPSDALSGNSGQGHDLRIQFVLPKGAYATTVLANVFDVVDASREASPLLQDDETDTKAEES
jgi:tRNA pseudouridine13 synthase